MHALTLPRLGQTMESGRIVEWLIEEGASYDEGAAIYSIETDKSILEVQATLPGTLLRKLAAVEDDIKVGRMVAVAADPHEAVQDTDVQRFVDAKSGVTERAEAATPNQVTVRETSPSRSSGATQISPRAMPRAKRLAKELGIDLAVIAPGSGSDGTIMERDVLRAAGKSAEGASASSTSATKARSKPLTPIQQAMVRHMTRSWAVPQFCQDVELDANALLDRRRRLTATGVEVSITALLLDALVSALKKVPQCNATFDGTALTEHAQMDAGIAVATSQGLLVPILRDCDVEFAARNRNLQSLLSRARDGRLLPDDLSGGTVTLSNLGASRVETGAPIINAPQVCLVFAGAIVEKPVVAQGQLSIGKRMHLVCVYDHRVIDGVTGAKFVDALAEAMASG